MAEIVIEGLDELMDWVDSLSEVSKSYGNEARDALAFWLENVMFTEIPKGQSHVLANSIRIEVNEDSIVIGATAPYTNFVEFGTGASKGSQKDLPGVFVKNLQGSNPNYPGAKVMYSRFSRDGNSFQGKLAGYQRGQAPNPFTQRTFERFQDEIDDFMNIILSNLMLEPGDGYDIGRLASRR